MPFNLYFRPWCAALFAALLLALALTGQYLRWYEKTWFDLRNRFSQPAERALGLADYRAVIQGKVIEGVASDVSALTFDPGRRSLFTVTNQNSELIELSLQGDVLRRIALNGFGDPEAVEYIRPGVFVISDERGHRLLAVKVDDSTLALDADDAEQWVLDLGVRKNRGFEGLAYDPGQARLFVGQEQSPMQIFEIKGFPSFAEPPRAVEIVRDPLRDRRLFVRDLSGLQFDERNGHLLALSDQSRMLVEMDVHGQPVGTLVLRRGAHGLEGSVPQAEGVALDDEGTLYVVSEPNLFYVFKKP
ncbi:SdiA-regulated domain-containing protein [Pseudomonas sp. dw_358]|uniref:SdiA-regulated domain-containing protein n=1 Tax=Pseudomonas sp. dw_358 TaxID=2720083 RepID=UPI001BD5B62D|nr:SdiA-regulated domain-containing protein [Pseudomonas sp. dw_358]